MRTKQQDHSINKMFWPVNIDSGIVCCSLLAFYCCYSHWIVRMCVCVYVLTFCSCYVFHWFAFGVCGDSCTCVLSCLFNLDSVSFHHTLPALLLLLLRFFGLMSNIEYNKANGFNGIFVVLPLLIENSNEKMNVIIFRKRFHFISFLLFNLVKHVQIYFNRIKFALLNPKNLVF